VYLWIPMWDSSSKDLLMSFLTSSSVVSKKDTQSRLYNILHHKNTVSTVRTEQSKVELWATQELSSVSASGDPHFSLPYTGWAFNCVCHSEPTRAMKMKIADFYEIWCD